MSEPDMATDQAKRAPLEDVMLAMDVVDTLRHREGLVARELGVEDRRGRLIERLREIYTAQGIDVSDAVLAQGVSALEEDRFSYTPPAESFQLRLARVYTDRARWGKPVSILLGFAAIILVGYLLLVALPEWQEKSAFPASLDNTFAQIVQIADEPIATDRAQALLQDARVAFDNDDYADAAQQKQQLESLLAQLQLTYELRIVSRPNELSGVWRIPESNASARNYYLIVEAIDAAGDRIKLPIVSEEDGKTRSVRSWGIRVNESAFQSISADKRDDGIIQNGLIGTKARGKLEPDYRIETSGKQITDW